jgi:MFS transporter, DHA1 family, inner membrane transport protein
MQETSTAPSPTTTATVIAGLFLGTVAFMITGIQPVLLGSLAEEGRLSEAALGRVAWIEVLALALASAIGPRLLRFGSARRTIAAACFTLALANAVVYVSHDTRLLILSRLIAGLMEGLLLATTNIAITRATHPERLSALFLMVSAIPQVAASYLLPAMIMPRFGADSGFGILFLLAVVGIGVAFLIGNEIQDAPPRKPTAQVWTPAVLIGLLGVILQNAGNGAGWEYQARVGENLHFSGQIVGTAIAADLIFQIVGTFAVAWIAWRLPFRAVLLLSCVIQAVILVTMSRVHASYAYISICAIFGMMWLGVNPFQVSLLVDLDKTRQAALLLASLQLVGFGTGPLICSFFVRPGNLEPAFWCAAGLVMASFVLYIVAMKLVAEVGVEPTRSVKNARF